MLRLPWDRIGPVPIQTIDLTPLVSSLVINDEAFAQNARVDLAKLPKIYLMRFDQLTLANLGPLDGTNNKQPASALVLGNKLFKLLPNVEQAINNNAKQIISFGGAWSNHIHALAAAGRHFGLATVGVIRSQRPLKLSPTLREAQAMGMRLSFVDRHHYQVLQEASMRDNLVNLVGEGEVVPAGGSNQNGVQGALKMGELLLKEMPDDVSDIWLAAATGGTAAGIIAALNASRKKQSKIDKKDHGSSPLSVFRTPTLTAVSVLKHAHLKRDIEAHLQSINGQLADQCQKTGTVSQPWRLISDSHHGGYARVDKALAVFLQDIEQLLEEPVDHVYMSKVFFALCRELAQQCFAVDATEQAKLNEEPNSIAIVHTGGQQGRRGWAPVNS